MIDTQKRKRKFYRNEMYSEILFIENGEREEREAQIFFSNSELYAGYWKIAVTESRGLIFSLP